MDGIGKGILWCFALVVGSILLVIPSGLILGGFVLIFSPNYRQEMIDHMNEQIESWHEKHLYHMKSFDYTGLKVVSGENLDSYSYSGGNVHISSSRNYLDEVNLFQRNDNPMLQDWQAFYFTTAIDLGRKNEIITFSEDSVYDLVVSFGEESISVSENLFIETSQFVYDRCVIINARTGAKKCVNAIDVCQQLGGEFFYSPFGENCFFRYKLNRICVLVDPTTGIPDRITEDAWSHGCFRHLHFAQKEFEYRYSSYEIIRSSMDDEKMIIGEETRLKDREIDLGDIRVEFRSKYDPEVSLNVVTKGLNYFPKGKKEKNGQAFTMIFVGFVPIFVLMLYVGFVLCKMNVKRKEKDNYEAWRTQTLRNFT